MAGTPFTVQWPGKLIFGPGRLAALGDEAKSLGCRAFVATTRDLSALGLTRRVQELLETAGLFFDKGFHGGRTFPPLAQVLDQKGRLVGQDQETVIVAHEVVKQFAKGKAHVCREFV